MKSGHLLGFHPIAFAHLFWPDPRHFAGAQRIEDRRSRRRQLEGIAIAARHQHGAAAPLPSARGSGEKIVCLVACALGIGETAGGDKFRNERKLLDQIVVEFAAALVVGERVVAVGRRFQRIPADEHAARLSCICAVDGEVVLDGEALVKVPSAKTAKGKRPMIKL